MLYYIWSMKTGCIIMLLLMLGACGSQYGGRRKHVGKWVGRTLLI